MKLKCLALIVPFVALAHSAWMQAPSISGTWSGNWMPKGGLPDAVTIELRLDNSGVLTGKFINPAPMEFSKATFSPKTGLIAVEATDQKSGKHYKLEGRIKDTELQGTLTAGDVSGELA
jgi:hypothetical protein